MQDIFEATAIVSAIQADPAWRLCADTAIPPVTGIGGDVLRRLPPVDRQPGTSVASISGGSSVTSALPEDWTYLAWMAETLHLLARRLVPDQAK